MYRISINLRFFICLSGFLVMPLAVAETLLDDGLGEIEEFRMQQLQAVQSDGDIAPFTTDGCSGNLSAYWGRLADTLPGFADDFGDKPPWQDCCVAHDKDYWSGNVIDGYSSRLNADQELRQCVVDTGTRLTPELSARYSVTDENVDRAFSVVADLMYKAVRLGGQPCSLLPWRWGYGWPNCAFAKASGTPSDYSDIKSDEHVVFFNTAGWLDPENTHWHIPIHAWIYEPADSLVRKGIFASLLESSYELKVTPETEAVFRQRTNLLIADNERGKKLVIRIAGQDIVLPESKENGHVYTTLRLPKDAISAVSEQGRVHYFAVTRPDDNRRFEGDVQLVSGQGVSVISDIDDTIKTSNVTDHKLLFENTFFKDFREVSGMPELYHRFSASGAKIHFVSSSPWQLYRPLLDFIDGAGFPWATLNLKAIRFRDDTLFNLFKKGTETKPEQIEPILQRYPQRRFILIGDSGEQDPEVYGDIARRYPAQIQRILIRNVDARIAQDERYKIAFQNVARNKWQIFDYPEQLAADDLLGVR